MICTTPPALQSALRWTDTLQLVFTAYAFPFWESEAPTVARASGSSGSVLLLPAGTAESCVLQARLVNRGSNPLTCAAIAAGGQRIAFEGMEIVPGGSLSMLLEGGLLMLPAAHRTPDSADEIRLPQRSASTVTFSADQRVEAEFLVRGVWL